MLSGYHRGVMISAPLARSMCSASRSPFQFSLSLAMPVRSWVPMRMEKYAAWTAARYVGGHEKVPIGGHETAH